MGQQQLLLVILVTILVGIMTVVAIRVFDNARDQSIKDNIQQELLEAATTAQAYYHKPAMLGGGNSSFQGITLEDIGLESESIISTFSLGVVSDESLEILADPASGIEDLTILVYSDSVSWGDN